MTEGVKAFGKCSVCGGGENDRIGECNKNLHFATGAMGFKVMTKQEEVGGVIDDVATGVLKPSQALRRLSELGVVIKVVEPFRIAQSINGDSLVAVEDLI